jgi:hypothetical protein
MQQLMNDERFYVHIIKRLIASHYISPSMRDDFGWVIIKNESGGFICDNYISDQIDGRRLCGHDCMDRHRIQVTDEQIVAMANDCIAMLFAMHDKLHTLQHIVYMTLIVTEYVGDVNWRQFCLDDCPIVLNMYKQFYKHSD